MAGHCVHACTDGKHEVHPHTNWNFTHEMKPAITLANKTSQILE